MLVSAKRTQETPHDRGEKHFKLSYSLHRLRWWGPHPQPLTFKPPNFQRTKFQHSSLGSEYLQVEGEVGGGIGREPLWFVLASHRHWPPKARTPKALLSPLTWVGHGKVVPPCGHFLLSQRTNWCFKALHNQRAAAAAAAKSLQSCLTLCIPIDGSPPGSPVPWILQARTLERVAISFSNA